MKKKTVEFNLNIPECPTEHEQPHLDQMHTILKEPGESYPVRSVHPELSPMPVISVEST